MKVTTCSRRPVLAPCDLPDFDHQIDPYVGCGHLCRYCYVLAGAETDWAEEIRIHEDIAGQLRAELEGVPPQRIYLGYFTDPYQPLEAELNQTRKALELLLELGHSASILTKSNLVTRDADLLAAMPDASVSVSVAFNNERTRALFEAGTINTMARIAALGELREAGVATTALICPVIPLVTKPLPLIEALAPVTDRIWIYGLSVQDRGAPYWRNVEAIISEHYPEEREEIDEIVFDRTHPWWRDLRASLERLRDERRLTLDIHV